MLSLLRPHTLLSRLEYQVVFSAGKMADAIQSFEFTTGLRGFYLYSTKKHWKPYLQQEKDYVDDSKSILAEIKGEDIDITSDSENDEDELEIL